MSWEQAEQISMMESAMREHEKQLDYRALLKKYMNHVIDREGVSFLYHGLPNAHKKFTVEEWAELERLDSEWR